MSCLLNAQKFAFHCHSGVSYKDKDMFQYLVDVVKHINRQPLDGFQKETAMIVGWLHKGMDAQNMRAGVRTIAKPEIEIFFGRDIVCFLAELQQKPAPEKGVEAQNSWFKKLSPVARIVVEAQTAVDTEYERQKLTSHNIPHAQHGQHQNY